MSKLEHDTHQIDKNIIPKTNNTVGKLIFLISSLASLFAMYYLLYRPIASDRYINLYLMVCLILFGLTVFYRESNYEDWNVKKMIAMGILAFSIFLGVISTIYLESNFETLRTNIGGFLYYEYLIGFFLILSIILCVYKAYGGVLASLIVISIIYLLYGNLAPGIFFHSGRSPEAALELLVLVFDGGVYHLIFNIGVTWILIFIVWAGIMEEYGLVDTFINLGYIIGSKFRSGVGQVAVITSMLMGSVSGSPMANSAVTGSFTIPLMKDSGFKSREAGGIEAVASTGGMILPPVMGSVAFIMASFVSGYNYADIIIVGAIPALIFYFCVIIAVDQIYSGKEISSDHDFDMNKREMLIDTAPAIISVAVLMYCLIIIGLDPGTSGVYTTLALIISYLIKRVATSDDRVFMDIQIVIASTFKGFRTGMVRVTPILLVLAGIGLLITSVNDSGVGYQLSGAIVEMAGSSSLLLLLLVAISSLLLGMGMPAVAAYLVTITLISPAMINVGFEEITAHFFVFYYATLASITPPIALCPAVTSKIANSGFYSTSFSAVKIGTPLFILPFIFAYNESLLVFNGLNTILTLIIVLVAFGLFTLILFDNKKFSYGGIGTKTVFLSGCLLLMLTPSMIL